MPIVDKIRIVFINLVFALGFACGLPVEAADTLAGKPNILLIVADDMGYSDLGCFGGDVKTPNLNALAAQGLRATNFYAGASCSPSRSMLLTGTDNHVAGIGNMSEWTGPTQRGKAGYEGYLNDRVVTVATLLRSAGYHTYMAGKWHLGDKPGQRPADRGFERDFALMQGAGSHWSDMLGLLPSEPKVTYTCNGEQVKELPDNYYSSKNLTDIIIKNIDGNKSDKHPFFAYLSYQAPHGPLAVPDSWRDKYRGKYDKGYDFVREKVRLTGEKRLGIAGNDTVCFPRLTNIPPWEKLTEEQRQQASRKMELYAAMIEYMDDQIGRLLAHLKKSGLYDNTLIVFISDNGAAGEDIVELLTKLDPKGKDWFNKTFDNRLENWGRPRSCVECGPPWAQVSSAPFRGFKGLVTEGGIRVPLILSGPGVKQAGKINRSVLHVMDITPTLLEVAGIQHPANKDGSNVEPPQGKSMCALLDGHKAAIRTDSDWLGWELFGNRAIRQGDWKLLYLLKAAGGSGDWQLFNLRHDPAEMHDLSAKYPERRTAMLKLWDEYAKRNGVISSDSGPYATHQP